MSIDDLFTPTERDQRERPAAVRGTIASAPIDSTTKVYVTIESFDGGENRHGPCRWMPRLISGPAVGDEALVVFDEQGDPWVVAWWPSS